MNEGIPMQENPALRGLGQNCVVAPPIPNYEIRIVKAENGFIVVVGCKTFVFAEWVVASEALGLYFKNPEEAQKKYCR